MELWGARLERMLCESEQKRLAALLPEERRQRLARLHDSAKQREPLCAYALLWLVLRERFGWTAWPEIVLGERGKPEFAGTGALHFNLSHTTGAVLVGLSEAPIGVDIQQIRPLSPRVQHRLDAAGKTADQYFQEWACYEAWIKRAGRSVDPHFTAREKVEAEELHCFPGYAAAVSGEGIAELHFCTLDALVHL